MSTTVGTTVDVEKIRRFIGVKSYPHEKSAGLAALGRVVAALDRERRQLERVKDERDALEEALREIEVHPWGETTIIGDMARRALADSGEK